MPWSRRFSWRKNVRNELALLWRLGLKKHECIAACGPNAKRVWRSDIAPQLRNGFTRHVY